MYILIHIFRIEDYTNVFQIGKLKGCGWGIKIFNCYDVLVFLSNNIKIITSYDET